MAIMAVEERLKKVNAFLSESLGNFISGSWRPAAGGRTTAVEDPPDGSVLAAVADSGPEDVDAAVLAAHEAFVGWAAMEAVDRAVLLHRLADMMERDAHILAQLESLDVGKALVNAEGF